MERTFITVTLGLKKLLQLLHSARRQNSIHTVGLFSAVSLSSDKQTCAKRKQ